MTQSPGGFARRFDVPLYPLRGLDGRRRSSGRLSVTAQPGLVLTVSARVRCPGVVVGWSWAGSRGAADRLLARDWSAICLGTRNPGYEGSAMKTGIRRGVRSLYWS